MDDSIKTSSELKYLTFEKGCEIQKKIEEAGILPSGYEPFVGVKVDYGFGNICLEEIKKGDTSVFKFYTVDRTAVDDCREFLKIEDAIEYLINFYGYHLDADEADIMRTIFYETLDLESDKKLCKVKKK